MSFKKVFLQGTIILIIAGFLTKILGFFNRILLSNLIGAKEIGIFQLIFPVFMFLHSLTCDGFETGLTKFIAQEVAKKEGYKAKQYMQIATIIIITLSIGAFLLLFFYSKEIAVGVLKEPQCTKCLQLISFTYPLIGIKAVIQSYYYALRKTMLPSISLFIEQMVRVGSIYLMSLYCVGIFKMDATLPVYGMLLGELISCMINIVVFYLGRKKRKTLFQKGKTSYKILLKKYYDYSIPLCGNRMLLTALQSMEAILIPYMLKFALGNGDLALELYGVLTGMALPFILFPSAITNALAVMLLPTISDAKATRKEVLISQMISKTLHFCIVLGILCTTVFLAYGKQLGLYIFNEPRAGGFLLILAWLCPFVYVATTMNSILNGLGKTSATLFNNTIASCVRIVSIVVGIPMIGMKGYLIGLLFSYGLLDLLSLWSISKENKFQFNSEKSIILPSIIAGVSAIVSYLGYYAFQQYCFMNRFWLIVIAVGILSTIYFVGIIVIEKINS